MRGFPLINVAILALVLGLLSVPLLEFSKKQGPDKIALRGNRASVPQTAQWPTEVGIRLAGSASLVEIVRGGTVLHTWKEPGTEFSHHLALPVYDQQMEFAVHIVWPEAAGETMAEVTVQPDGDACEPQMQNVWGSGDTTETLQFSWPKAKAP